MKYLLAFLLITASIAHAGVGDVRVELYPQAISGAAWKLTRNNIDHSQWQATGATVFDVPAGSYQVIFKPVHGWFSPASVNLLITENEFVTLTATYMQSPGEIVVSVQPVNVRQLGAVFAVDNGDWITPGELLMLESGFYTVQFKPVHGWHTPTELNIQIRQGVRREISATYRRNYAAGNVYHPSSRILELADVAVPVDGRNVIVKNLFLRFNADGTITFFSTEEN